MFGDLSSIVDCTNALIHMVYGERSIAESQSMIVETRQRLASSDITCGINVAESTVQFDDALKLLGVTLDASLSFDKHVTNVVRSGVTRVGDTRGGN